MRTKLPPLTDLAQLLRMQEGRTIWIAWNGRDWAWTSESGLMRALPQSFRYCVRCTVPAPLARARYLAMDLRERLTELRKGPKA